jgi:peptide/nickel transport system permease protein
MLREILPRVIGPIMVLATLELGSLIIWISGLSFLGLGAQPPSPEWGAMLSDGRAYLLMFPHLMIFPGLMIFLTVFALVMIGEGLRDMLDPERVAVRRATL